MSDIKFNTVPNFAKAGAVNSGFRFVCCSMAWLSLALSHTVVTHAEDWPQWRGPRRDGTWNETGIVDQFRSEQLPRKWTARIGPGYSGPTVAGGRVYVTDRLVEPEQVESVLCFDAETGKSLWSFTYEASYSIGYSAGPRAAVSVDEGRAFALGAMGHLYCLDAATGKLLWKHDLNAEYKIRMPIWGITSSPLVDGDLLIVQVGGRDGACIVAFDKKTGAERWRALDDDAAYAAARSTGATSFCPRRWFCSWPRRSSTKTGFLSAAFTMAR
jgi:outer membrane protein assembly factor BamB